MLMGCRRLSAVALGSATMVSNRPRCPPGCPVRRGLRLASLCLVALTMATLVFVSSGAAQRQAIVPVRDTTRLTVGTATLAVDHDAMVSADSALLGKVIPLGNWMMGSVTPGRLVTSSGLVIDEKVVPSGTYSLWVVVTGQSAVLRVNRDLPKMRMSYDSTHDVARVPLSIGRTDSVIRRFRVRIDPAPRVVSTVRFSFLRPENPRCPTYFQCFDISVEPAERPDAMLVFEWQRLRWTVPVRFVPDSSVRHPPSPASPSAPPNRRLLRTRPEAPRPPR